MSVNFKDVPAQEAKPLKEKLISLLENYNGINFVALPDFLKRRTNALRNLQLKRNELEHQYHKELQALDLKYHKLYEPLHEKRQQIISGQYEPTDAECQLPETIKKFDDENLEQFKQLPEDLKEPSFSQQEVATLQKCVKGLPGFWLGCLNSTFNFTDCIEPHDKEVLRHLSDITIDYEEKDDILQYKLNFQFTENPYFDNSVLTKTYHLRVGPDPSEPLSYEGPEVIKSVGCDIKWKEGKDLTKHVIVVKQKNKTDGRIRHKEKQEDQDSFFRFFGPPEMPEDKSKVDEILGGLIAVDFELGEAIRQSLIPRAVLFYTGQYDADDDDEEDEEEDDEEDDDEDSDDDSDDDIDDEVDSDDSLENGNDQKGLIEKSPKSKKET